MRTILRVFFHLLYHQFAFAYDFVAGVVSFGRWKDWILEVVPFIQGTRTLEIGHGPGHLHRFLLNRGLVAVAIDESAPMTRLAKHKLEESYLVSSSERISSDGTYGTRQSDYTQNNLTRGLAQQLPFRNEAFDTVISTFPAEYIFDPSTLTEASRVLTDKGRFIILPGVLITSRKIWERFMAWVYQFTGQTPLNLSEILHERSKEPFAKAGFQVDIKELEVKSGIAFIVIASKSQPAQ